MQIMKLAALAMFAASVLGFSTLTSTGCSSTDDTCDPATENCNTAGTLGDDDDDNAGGSAGSAGSSNGGSAGSGANTGSDSAEKFAAAVNGGSACQACIDGLSGSVQDAGGQTSNCAGVAAACDNDQACVNLISTANSERGSKPNSTPTCWLGKANELVAESATATSDAFYACAVFGSCAASCGNLTNQTEACE